MENENINFGKKKEKVHLTDWSYNYPVWAVFSPKTIIGCNGIVFAEASSLAVYRYFQTASLKLVCKLLRDLDFFSSKCLNLKKFSRNIVHKTTLAM